MQRLVRIGLAITSLAVAFLALSDNPQRRALAADAPPTAAWDGFQKDVQPLFNKYCISCHGNTDPEADIKLSAFNGAESLEKNFQNLEKVVEMLDSRKMPPKNKPRPTDAELNSALAWLTTYTKATNCDGPRNPGRVTIHRLNRAEYNNTIRDLLAIDFRPADGFPVDDAGYGFDNIGDVLSMAPVLMEKYLTASGQVLDKALFSEPAIPPITFRPEAATIEGTVPKSDPKADSGFAQFGRNMLYGRTFETLGEIYVDYDFPTEGSYIFRVRGYGTQGTAVRQRPFVQFRVNGQDVGEPIQIKEDLRNTSVYALDPVKFTPGKRRVTLVFTNGATAEEVAAAKVAAEVAAAAAAAAATQPATAPAEADANANPAANVAAAVNAVAVPAPVAEAVAIPAPAAAPAADPAAVVAPVVAPAAADAAVAPAPAAADPAAAAAAPAAGARGRGARGAAGARGARGRGGRGGAAPIGPGKPTLGVVWFEVEGPIEVTPNRMPESYRRVMVVQPSATVTKQQAAEQIIRNFTTRAYRRPVTDEEMKRLMALWSSFDSSSDSFERSIRDTLEPVLASPYFLYRIEKDPTPKDENGIRTLDDYELATRLSYFLWSSMPDEELLALARKGQLRTNLEKQVQRMIADPKSVSLVENFAGQWLQLRQMNNVTPDTKNFPDFDDALRAAMIKETQMFFSAIMKEDRSVLTFLDADFTYVNERLAKHYGIPDITGDEFRRIPLTAAQRGGGGLLTQASILTITSYPNRTSPVQRGKWVLENLLNAPPPPPPADVPKLAEAEQGPITGTLRQRMEQHRTNPACAACHARMDPIGFGLENFNGIGAWRSEDNSQPIDASGEFTDGKTFKGPAELKQILKGRQEQFCRCLSEKLLTYALGRGLETYDRCTVEDLVQSLKKQDYKFSTLVMEIVKSDPFQKRGLK